MNENPNKKKLSEQLPSHSVNPGSWQRLSAKLDAANADAAYYKNLEQLPKHTPDEGSWNIIYNRLNRIAFAKTATRISLTAAAGLLLFFSVSRISDDRQQTPVTPGLAIQERPKDRPALTKPSKSVVSQLSGVLNPNRNKAVNQNGNSALVYTTAMPEAIHDKGSKEPIVSDKETAINTDSSIQTDIIPETSTQNPVIPGISFPFNPGLNNKLHPGSTPFVTDKISPTTTATLPYSVSTPKELIPVSKPSHFSLAMEYLPENIYTGDGNSLFHNVDLAASYTKNKLRINTSLGMAYNEDQLTFAMNYDIKSTVTAMGADGQLDTLGYNLDRMESEYQGTEKHQYLTYNLGIGGRLFSFGKFSSWINVGTGFGFSLNNPDLIASTKKSVKAQYNAMNTIVNSSDPVYNDVYMNLNTGIDFNYKVLSRLSLSLTPMSRWYFKPVLTQNNEATDDLTFGFSTGIKYDF
jgi:hypothetical protein